MADIVVLIPHYNDLKGLHKSLSSIIDTEPIDVLIVDDGSKEIPDERILQNQFKNINQITLILSTPNKGQAAVQNIGLRHIQRLGQYKFIARLDSGDTAYPQRFSIQKTFLQNHPEIFLVGSHARIIDMQGKELFTAKMPLRHSEIKKRIHAQSCFIHSSVMFRSEAIEKVGLYPENYYGNDDYSFWFKFIKQFQTGNIDTCLVDYELNLNSLSRSKYRKELRSRIRIMFQNFSVQYLGYSIRGLTKAFAGYIIGVKFASRAAILINQ